jgi:hypothetical protein
MSQPSDNPTREVTNPQATITGAKIALVGTIITAIIGATATITVALVQRNNPVPPPTTPAPDSHAAEPNPSVTPSTPPAQLATTTPPASPDGVAYRCTGSAPAGIEITYGRSGSGLQATRLPFTAQDSKVSETAGYYAIRAQLHGGGHVTCTLTVTAAGHSTRSSGTARGGYNEATPQICADYERHWSACG